jgi:hypothetical protein
MAGKLDGERVLGGADEEVLDVVWSDDHLPDA